MAHSMQMIHELPASVATMQAKAFQLAEELQMVRAQVTSVSKPNSTSATAAAPSEPANALASTASTCKLQQAAASLETPAVFRRLSQGNAFAAKNVANTSDTQQLAALQCQKLEAEVQLWKCKHMEAVKELDRHQQSYMRREDKLKMQLAAFIQPQHTPESEDTGSGIGDSSTAESSAETSAPDSKVQKAPKPATLQEMQEQVLHGLDDLLQRQRLQMRTEEAQQLRQFRSRLAEIEGQLQACKQAAAEHQGDWMEKTLTLREELARTQEIASKLDAMYKLAEDEAAQLRVQFRAQEDDRQHLVRQLVAAKRDNNRLKQEQTALQEELDAIIALAVETEAGEAPPAKASSISASILAETPHCSTASEMRRSSNSSLAAAITEVASRRGSSNASSVAPLIGMLNRPVTACQGQQQHQEAAQHVRPWSAAPLQQHELRPAKLCSAAAGSSIKSAAVAAKMQRYGHVIQKLQKLLESERRQLRQLRGQYTAELGRRNELQSLLLDTMQQAKEQYREAESTFLAEQRQAAPRSLAVLAVDERRPRRASATASRPRSRPPGLATASAGCCSKRTGFSRPCSAVQTAPASAATTAPGQSECGPLDQEAWEHLLNELLTKQKVLELLFERAFPDFLNESEELYGSSRQPQQPSEQLQHITVSQMRQLWGSQLQQPQHPAGVHETAGLGETSPKGSGYSGELLDEGLVSSDSEDVHPLRNCALEAKAVHGTASEAPLQSQPQQQSGQHLGLERTHPAGADEGHSRHSSTMIAVVEQQLCCTADDQPSPDHHQQQQQLKQEPGSSCLPSGNATLGSLSSPVMPSFPARHPLHHNVIRRPYSAAVQHPEAAGSSRRPVSAAASGTSARLPGRSAGRPATAAGRRGSTEQQWKPVATAREQTAEATAAGADTGHKICSSKSSRNQSMSIGKAAQQAANSMLTAGQGKPASTGQWGMNAASISECFLSKG